MPLLAVSGYRYLLTPALISVCLLPRRGLPRRGCTNNGSRPEAELELTDHELWGPGSVVLTAKIPMVAGTPESHLRTDTTPIFVEMPEGVVNNFYAPPARVMGSEQRHGVRTFFSALRTPDAGHHSCTPVTAGNSLTTGGSLSAG